MAPLLAIGAATTMFLTPALIFPGLVWLTLGVMLWTRGRGPTRTRSRAE